MLKEIDENISHDDIDIAHSLGKSKTNKTPNIIVRFASRRTRNNIYKERRKLKSNAPRKPYSERVFINENLTKRNKHRQSNDSRVIAIRSDKDIEHIKNPMDNPRNPN